VPRRLLFFSLAAVLMALGCRRKTEILPEGAKQVMRSDSTETTDDMQVKKREYQFFLQGKQFVCEGREFATDEQAARAAKGSIAERPSERLDTEAATYAASGRSVWLKTRRELVWCMLASGKSEAANSDAALAVVQAQFKQKFKQITN